MKDESHYSYERWTHTLTTITIVFVRECRSMFIKSPASIARDRAFILNRIIFKYAPYYLLFIEIGIEGLWIHLIKLDTIVYKK